MLHRSLVPDAHVKKRPRVYVAGPYSADNVLKVLENMNRGSRAAVELMLRGYAPLTPWHDFMHSMMIRHDAGEKLMLSDYYEMTIEYVEQCDAMYVVPTDNGYGGEWQDSTGTHKEIQRAMLRRVPVVLGDYDVLQYVCGISQAESNAALARLRERGRIERLHGVYWFEGYPQHRADGVEEEDEWYGKGGEVIGAQ